ncbi:MAG: hypothetical protein AAF532_15080 [Planctomycetota bacterium]
MDRPEHEASSGGQGPAASTSYPRWVVGGGAAVSLLAAAGLFVAAPDRPFLWSGALRAGVLLGVFWLALPTKSRPAAWADVKPGPVVIGLATLFLVVRFPKVGVPLAVLLVIVRYVSSRSPFRRKDGRRSA